MLERDTLSLLPRALDALEQGYRSLPAFTPPGVDTAALAGVLEEVARRLQDDYPFFHPLYAAHMQQPPHPVARAAYALALWMNPNGHAPAGGRASAAMEREAVGAMAALAGWDRFAGHLCGGGTLANAEALWVAGKMRPGAVVVASSEAHYSHGRMSGVLGLPFEAVPCDGSLRVDVDALATRLGRGDVGTVIATMGTTATGAVDPLPQLVALRRRHGFRLHVDAAYGGYFALVDGLDSAARAAFDSLREADSIVIDPHKHGLQPYGCSAVLFRDPLDGRCFRQRSPCADDADDPPHEFGFECSRPGAAAIALWATMRLMPLVRDGEFAAMLGSARAAALALHGLLRADERFLAPLAPDLDIVVWAPRGATAAEAGASAREILAECTKRGLYLSLADVPCVAFGDASFAAGRERVTCLRATLMKETHATWVQRIFDIVSQATDAVLARDLMRAARGPSAKSAAAVAAGGRAPERERSARP